jgi:hypothetical protein
MSNFIVVEEEVELFGIFSIREFNVFLTFWWKAVDAVIRLISLHAP